MGKPFPGFSSRLAQDLIAMESSVQELVVRWPRVCSIEASELREVETGREEACEA